MCHARILPAVAMVLSLCLSDVANAQFNRNTGSTGMGMGSSTGMGKSSGSTGMFGSSSAGKNNNNNAGSQRASMGGATSDQMLRSARGKNNIVGADSTDARNFLGIAKAGQGNTTMQPIRRNTKAQANKNQANNNDNRAGSKNVRPTLDLGFEYEGQKFDSLSQDMSARLAKAPGLKIQGRADVAVENGVATLRGTAASEHDRDLAGQMLLLEPGIHRVDNQLTVSSVEGK
jgi:osmotically-inducible protein OsmY